MYEETEQAIWNISNSLKALVDGRAVQKQPEVTWLYDETAAIHDRRLGNGDPGGRMKVCAWRIDLPQLPWRLRVLYVVQRWLSTYAWEEAENELDDEFHIFEPNRFRNDAAAIRYAIDQFDELAAELAQRVRDRAEQVDEVNIA